eukprot:CAMPEP_0201720890 /NCGR_PEP_ID=MMETSP0593-20130828/5720_1 /ASSEMBLY_ACC=CAM_ASM_000672 /TAXON_ID=267983 /ORGANISM="Skeletonema japonicum, Strain CCMP2506" /LENGTH=284 /DNA_ID=CAMNT_0048211603 /DNA_START=152 /DNA_END=1006 /DNA_ORIENTATION=+
MVVTPYFSLLPLVVAVFVYCVVTPPTRWCKQTRGGLLGEEYIQSKQDAFNFARRVVDEGYSIWDEPSTNWETMFKAADNKLHVESRRITEGPFATSGIFVTRATGTITGADADAVYGHFITPEGLLLLDPTMDVVEAARYIERYTKDKETYVDVHKSFNAMPPGVTDRYLLVLNGYYKKDRYFFCKSIIHDSIPGASPYFIFANETSSALPVPATTRDEHGERAVNTFHFHIQPTQDKKGAIVRMVNYVDFQVRSTMMNWLISKAFFPGVYDRIEAMFGKASEK